jgi:nitrogen regulatory protein P-II 1
LEAKRLKKIEAILRPQKLHDTIKSLHAIGVTAFTVNQVVGRGQQKDRTGIYRGRNYNVSLHPKVKMEIVISDFMVERTVQAICAAAQTGEAGDGKIFISSVEQAINIRTGVVDETIDELQPLQMKEEV